jgi:hypothetical protein
MLIAREKEPVKKKGGACASNNRKTGSNQSKNESENAHAEGSNKQRVCEEETFPVVASVFFIDPADAPNFVVPSARAGKGK